MTEVQTLANYDAAVQPISHYAIRTSPWKPVIDCVTITRSFSLMIYLDSSFFKSHAVFLTNIVSLPVFHI